MALIDNNQIIIVRGGGDLATGVVQKFHRAGFHVLVLEISAPTAVRRSVALCEAVYDGVKQVEDVTCRLISGIDEAEACWTEKSVPLIVDPHGASIKEINPAAVIDAILAKRNLGTTRCMADVTIGLGPGFNAGEDVDAVIETDRGHDLGRLILQGCAKPDTGIPGEIEGESSQRVLRAPSTGIMINIKQIGSLVEQGEAVFSVSGAQVNAPFKGVLRGLLRENAHVQKGMKVGDIDPRFDVDWRTISDKARSLGGAALEAYLYLNKRKGERL